MTDREIDDLVVRIHEMSNRVGGCFVLDIKKLEAFRKAQREIEAEIAVYKERVRALDHGAN